MHRLASLALLLLLVCSCQSTTAGGLAAPSIDHIILGIANLDDGIAAFTRATGVTPQRGGRHPGAGTENALVSLGNGRYLEILAPTPGALLSSEDAALREMTSLTPIGWAIRVDDADRVRSALLARDVMTTTPEAGSRVTEDGKTLQWSTFGVESPELRTAPFFIQWDASSAHPSTTSPSGCELRSLELREPQAERLTHMFRAVPEHVRIDSAPRPRMRLTLQCGNRTASFGE